MAGMTEDDKRAWTFMSQTPPADWPDECCMRFTGHVLRLVNGRFPGIDAEDVAQEVFLKMLEWDEWDAPVTRFKSPGAFKAYLTTTIKNQAKDVYRSKAGQVRLAKVYSTKAESASRRGDEAIAPEDAATRRAQSEHLGKAFRQYLCDFVGTLNQRERALDALQFLLRHAPLPQKGSVFFEDRLSDFLSILYGTVPPREFIDEYMAARPGLHRDNARKRLLRLQSDFRKFAEASDSVLSEHELRDFLRG